MQRITKQLWIVLVIGLFLGSFASQTLAEEKGLVGWWKFDEGEGTVAKDSSGKGNDATIHGATWTKKGQSGNALFFDGKSSVNCGNDASLNISDEFTLEMWIKVSEQATMAYTLIKKSMWAHGWQTYIQPHFIVVSSKGFGNKIYRRKFPVGKFYPFYHIAITCGKSDTGKELKFYVDGALGKTFPVTGGLKTNSSPVIIGAYASNESDFFKGIIDEVRIYNRPLSAKEVKTHYDELSVF